MRFRYKAAGLAMVAALLAITGSPAGAASGTATNDAIGTDYDAACVVNTRTSAADANSITTDGCEGITTYDGSATAIDIGHILHAPGGYVWCPPYGWQTWDLCLWYRLNDLTAQPMMGSLLHVTALNLPQPGSRVQPDGTEATLDTPSPAFTGVNYYNLFQNKSVQNNVPTNPKGGCTRVGTGTPVYDQYGSWKDGHHFFTNYSVSWDGEKWVHSAQVGEYDPRPDGGFLFYELGTNSGDGWTSSNPYMRYGIEWNVLVEESDAGTAITVEADAVFRTPDNNCAEGFFKHAYVNPGDTVGNAKGVTTANMVVTLPVSVPLSLACTTGLVCASDLHTVGGYVFVGDVTNGSSTAGGLGANISGISYTAGAGNLGVADTLGDGPTCPTPTFGGLLPTNPLFTPDVACQIDDDSISRGTLLSEFWETTQNFTAVP